MAWTGTTSRHVTRVPSASGCWLCFLCFILYNIANEGRLQFCDLQHTYTQIKFNYCNNILVIIAEFKSFKYMLLAYLMYYVTLLRKCIVIYACNVCLFNTRFVMWHITVSV